MYDTLIQKYENDNYLLEIHLDYYPTDPREWDNLGTIIAKHREYNLGDVSYHRYDGDMYDMLIDQLCNEFDIYREDIEDEDELLDRIIYLPISMYEHSNIHLSIGSRNQIGWIYCTKGRANEWTGYTKKELYLGEPDREPDVGEHIKIKSRDNWGKVIDKDNDIYTVDFDYHKTTNARDKSNKISISKEEVTEVMSDRAENNLRLELETYDNYVSGSVYKFNFQKKEFCECCNNIDYIDIDSCAGFYGYDIEENGMLYHLPEEARKLYNNTKNVA